MCIVYCPLVRHGMPFGANALISRGRTAPTLPSQTEAKAKADYGVIRSLTWEHPADVSKKTHSRFPPVFNSAAKIAMPLCLVIPLSSKPCKPIGREVRISDWITIDTTGVEHIGNCECV